MVCIYCGGSTQVSNSRLQKRNNAVWRRRACANCQAIFTTIESTDLSSAVMVNGPKGRLTPFNRDRLLISVHESCKHRQNALDDALALTQTIVGDIIKTLGTTGAIEKEVISTVSYAVLERFDPVAATVYAAYHLKT